MINDARDAKDKAFRPRHAHPFELVIKKNHEWATLPLFSLGYLETMWLSLGDECHDHGKKAATLTGIPEPFSLNKAAARNFRLERNPKDFLSLGSQKTSLDAVP